MAYRNLAKKSLRGPTAPMKRFVDLETKDLNSEVIKTTNSFSDEIKTISSFSSDHSLTNSQENQKLNQYEKKVKGRFDNIVPLLRKVSSFQNDLNFVDRAQKLCRSELGYELPSHILEKAWVGSVDISALFAWCVFVRLLAKLSDVGGCRRVAARAEAFSRVKNHQQLQLCPFQQAEFRKLY